MPRFYLHLHEGEPVLDDEGELFPDLHAATEAAVKAARGLAADRVLNGRLNLTHSIEIAGELGVVVRAVTFRDAVAVEG
jgi:hypothetical protein